MSESESDSEPVAGAVFGFTGTVPKDEVAPAKRARPTTVDPMSDTQRGLQSRAGQTARKKRQGLRQRSLPKELHVTAEHISSLSELQSLLVTFNDPYAAGTDLASHIEEIPLLARRLVRTARIQTGHMQLSQVGHALSLLGNKALERELLELLEDMTEVKFDLLDKENLNKSSSTPHKKK
jgi:hypothetical protein